MAAALGRRSVTLLVSISIALLWAGPLSAQEAYPPPAADDAIDIEDEARVAEVRGAVLEDERALPMTGATVAGLTALGLAALALGATALSLHRRRAHPVR